MNIINWIQNWYQQQCDGEWEHEYGIRISTLDNPGWDIEIDLHYTSMENLYQDYKLIQESDQDWYGYSIKNAVFNAAGDPQKLEYLLSLFKELASKHT